MIRLRAELVRGSVREGGRSSRGIFGPEVQGDTRRASVRGQVKN